MAEQRRSSSAGARKRGSTARKTSARKKPSSRKGPTRGTAPSAPDISKLQLLKTSKAARDHEPSTVDAMGQDKRREVIGHAYGPSKRSQIAVLGGFLAVCLVLFFGLGALARHSDDNPGTHEAAPWARDGANPPPAVRPE